MIRGHFRQLLMPPDTSARHKAITSLLSTDSGKLLDVGGNRDELALFARHLEVTSVNVNGEDADLIYDGHTLPFKEGSFDFVTSLDVLEHIPDADRERHVTELLRVARTEALVCCPLGSSDHVAAELAVAQSFESITGARHRFLDEHLDLGLPTEAELRTIAEATGLEFDFFFQGDFRLVNQVFLDGVKLRTRPNLRSVFRYIASWNRARASTRLELEPCRFTNRVYLKITK